MLSFVLLTVLSCNPRTPARLVWLKLLPPEYGHGQNPMASEIKRLGMGLSASLDRDLQEVYGPFHN